MKAPLLIVALSLAGCGQPTYLPDGGRPRQQCTDTATVIGVKAVDLMGVPVSDAVVTATNTSNGKVYTGTTNGSGVCNDITEQIGQGLVRLTVTAGALSAAPYDIQVTCSECDCTAMPGAVTVILR